MSLNVKLQSSDGIIFDTPIKIAIKLKIIRDMLNFCSDDKSDEIIAIDNVRSNILDMVLTWIEHHLNDDMETLVKHTNFTIPEWDKTFLEIPKTDLADLIIACNFLNIQPLYLIACKTLAKMIDEKSVQEVREIINIPEEGPN
ncbi:S-phase kinase-associated protein 1-like [Drosophila obscura]|uniref:S-phase kinase-associated protein 1-like n=1 Tax=Drosophila obscura TaxID=7282 RepID=UPI001BB20DC5|nr:S-phase kinase-associated protein 1-like [Drosophila obscura]